MESGKSFFRTFFDDPVTKIRARWIDCEQRTIRRVIEQKYPEQPEIRQTYWVTGSPEEYEGMSADPVECLVQRFAHSQPGNTMAQRTWSRRLYIVMPVAAAVAAVGAYLKLKVAPSMPSPMFGSVVSAGIVFAGAMLAAAPWLFTKFTASLMLPRVPVRQDEIDAARATMLRCFVRPVDDSTPADFRDRLRVLVADAEGRSVAGQILSTDLEYSAVRAEWVASRKVLLALGLALIAPAAIAFAPWAAVGLYFVLVRGELKAFIAGGSENEMAGRKKVAGVFFILSALVVAMLSGAARGAADSQGFNVGWLYIAIMWFLAIRTALTKESPLSLRSRQQDQAVRETGTELLIDKAGPEHFVQTELARVEQIANAKRDESPFTEFATSTGLFAQRRDPFAPSEKGLPVGLTFDDQKTHVWVFGKSGSGKTAAIIRPLVVPWIAASGYGTLVLDGKGALPLVFANMPGFKVISPKHGKCNPIQGMKPAAVADVLTQVLQGTSQPEKGENGSFFTNAARLMLHMGCIVLRAAGKPYTLPELYRFCMLPVALSKVEVKDPETGEVKEVRTNDRLEILKTIPREKANDPLIRAAMNYWVVDLVKDDERTVSNIVITVQTWLGNVVLHEELGPWCDTGDDESGWTVENVLTGEKAGLLLPESQFGKSGTALTALTMRKLYDAVKARGDDWASQEGQTAVLLCVDEIQVLLTPEDMEVAGVARSLGLYCLSATQNISGVYQRLGSKEGVDNMLGNYATLIALPTNDDATDAYVEKRLGSIWKATAETYYGLPDAQSDIGMYRNSGVDKQTRQIDLVRQSYLSAPRLRYAIGLWHREHTVLSAVRGDSHHALIGPDENYTPMSKPQLALGLAPIVEAREINTLLARRGTAIFIGNRAGAPRRDMVRLSAFDAFDREAEVGKRPSVDMGSVVEMLHEDETATA